MSEWTIYSKDGVAKATVKELELHDEWMAECFITVTVKSEKPIYFSVGDYIDYRGERYTINYDPTVLKKARRDTYGEGFVYDNIKFVGVQNELVLCDFNDIVLSDNKIHYTSLATFPFYCETADDLLDRIQANLEELYPGEWIVISPMLDRDRQRGFCVGHEQAFVNAYNKYIGGGSFSYEKTGVAMTVDNITCWEALSKVHSDFSLDFIIRGRVVIVGTAGVFTSNKFQYGKGKGLYEIELIGDSEQKIVTRLRAYGAETNLPLNYYANKHKRMFIKGLKDAYESEVATGYTIYRIDTTIPYSSIKGAIQREDTNVTLSYGNLTAKADFNFYTDEDSGAEYLCASLHDGNEAFFNAISDNVKVYIEDGIDINMWPSDYIEESGDFPALLTINRLMLPGFPDVSLLDWVQENRPELLEEGFNFSDDINRPYIDSPNVELYGIRPYSIYFDGNNDNEDIHPTIEGMTWADRACDEVVRADQIEDSGVLPEDATSSDKRFTIYIPYAGFDMQALYQDGASIELRDGMCGARSMKIVKVNDLDTDSNWPCTCERAYDDTLHLYFPYNDFQIKSSDHFVLTGIDLPDSYVEAASIKLFDAAVEALRKNHAPRVTFQPRIDEIWMQRQHDAAIASQGVIESLHDTLKAGDYFAFADEDLGIDAQIIIDVLTIKENGNNGIPTYEVTLREEKVVSTLEKTIQKITSGVNGGAGGSGGYNSRQIGSLVELEGSQLFLSKLHDDEAQGLIGFLKGAWFGATKWMIDALGNATLNNVTFSGILRGTQAIINKIKSSNYTGDGMLDTGWQIINDYEGTNSKAVFDYLYIRKKATFEELEIRKLTQLGGNFVFSPASGRAWRIEAYKNYTINSQGKYEGIDLLGYSEVTIPYTLGGAMLSLFKKLFKRTPDPNNDNGRYLLGRKKMIARKFTDEELRDMRFVRIFLFTDDGSTTTMNGWTVNALARCQTFNIESQMDFDGSSWTGKKVSNTYWWRRVRGVGKGLCDDGKEHEYVDFLVNQADKSEEEDSGSDIPSVGDVFVQLGHRTNTQLSNAIMIETYSGDAPAIKEYRKIGIGSGSPFNLNDTQKTKISPTTGTVMYSTAFHIETQYGDVLVPKDRGMWSSIAPSQDGKRHCYYYDRVSHLGSYWICIVSETTLEPGESEEQLKAWEKQVSKGDKGEASFKSSVFCRYATKPTKAPRADTPEGTTWNTYDNPLPPPEENQPTWTDGIPSGTGTIWMSTRIFSTDGQAPQQAAWTDVQLMSDTESFDVEFSPVASNPGNPTDNPNNWYDPTTDPSADWANMIWMAERTKENGVWGNWKISKIKGEQGSFKSRVFCRSNTTPDTPSSATPQGTTYNTFDNPVPPPQKNAQGQVVITWTDGIPSTPAGSIIWSSVNTFDSTGDHAEWSVPVQETDTATLDIEFSPAEVCPDKPKGAPYTNREPNWYDPTSPNFPSAGTMIWRAERKVKNGAWEEGGDWVMSRIYGEPGVSGAFKSRVFRRTNTDISNVRPTGGTYAEPWPTDVDVNNKKLWSDGIPNDSEEMLWSSVATFTPSTTNPTWSHPAKETDTADLDIEFSLKPADTQPEPPSGDTPHADHSQDVDSHGNSNPWYDPTRNNIPSGKSWSDMVWRAERKVKNGAYDGAWVVTQIKGEKGTNAQTTYLFYTGPTDVSVTAAIIKRDYASQNWTNTAPSPTADYPLVWVGVWNNIDAKTGVDPKQKEPNSVSLFSKYGENGKSIIPIPSSLVITQQKVDGGAWPLDNIDERITIVARNGSTIINATISELTKENCDASIQGSGTTEAYIQITAIHKVEVIPTTGNYVIVSGKYEKYTGDKPNQQKNEDGTWNWKYAPSGSVSFKVTASGYGETFEANLKVPFGCNLIGTYYLMIEDDVKTEIHSKVETEIDKQGLLKVSEFDAQYEQSAQGDKANITAVINEIKGENGTYDESRHVFNNSRVNTAYESTQTIKADWYADDPDHPGQQVPVLSQYSQTHQLPNIISSEVGTTGTSANDAILGLSKWNNYSTIGQTDAKIGLKVNQLSQSISDAAFSSPGSWEQGSTGGEDNTKKYADIKKSSDYRIRTKNVMPIDTKMTIALSAAYDLCVHAFGENEKLLAFSNGDYYMWFTSTSVTLTVGSTLPEGTKYVAFLLAKSPYGNTVKIVPDDVIDAVTKGDLLSCGIDIDQKKITMQANEIAFKMVTGDETTLNFDTAAGVYKIGAFTFDQYCLGTTIGHNNNYTLLYEDGHIKVRRTDSDNVIESAGNIEMKTTLISSSTSTTRYNAFTISDTSTTLGTTVGTTTIQGNTINIGTSAGGTSIGNSSNQLYLKGSSGNGLNVGVKTDCPLIVNGDVRVRSAVKVMTQNSTEEDAGLRIYYETASGQDRLRIKPGAKSHWVTQAEATSSTGGIGVGEVFLDNSGFLRVKRPEDVQ